jgi:hypothetical protein
MTGPEPAAVSLKKFAGTFRESENRAPAVISCDVDVLAGCSGGVGARPHRAARFTKNLERAPTLGGRACSIGLPQRNSRGSRRVRLTLQVRVLFADTTSVRLVVLKALVLGLTERELTV